MDRNINEQKEKIMLLVKKEKLKNVVTEFNKLTGEKVKFRTQANGNVSFTFKNLNFVNKRGNFEKVQLVVSADKIDSQLNQNLLLNNLVKYCKLHQKRMGYEQLDSNMHLFEKDLKQTICSIVTLENRLMTKRNSNQNQMRVVVKNNGIVSISFKNQEVLTVGSKDTNTVDSAEFYSIMKRRVKKANKYKENLKDYLVA